MSGLEERIRWILRERGLKQRELSLKSGLSESSVGVTLSRLRKNPEADINTETLLGMAAGGGVSPTWLLTGEGDPDDEKAMKRLCERGDWPEARVEARRMIPSVPDHYLDEAGDYVGPVSRPLDPVFIANFARELWDWESRSAKSER